MYASISRYIKLAIEIAPCLQQILKIIVQQNNSLDLSDDQWIIFRTEITAFISKLKDLGVEFHESCMLEPLKKDDHLQIIQNCKDGIEEMNKSIYRRIIAPAAKDSFLLGNSSMVLAERDIEYLKKCKQHLRPSLLVGAQRSPINETNEEHVIKCVELMDDALLAFSRMSMKRNLFSGRSLYLHSIVPFNVILSESVFNEVRSYLCHYQTSGVKLAENLFVYTFTPIKYNFDKDIMGTLYNLKQDTLGLFDIMSSVDTSLEMIEYEKQGEWRKLALMIDQNFGPNAVFNKIIGASISSADFSLDLLVEIGSEFLNPDPHSSKVDNHKLFRARFKGYNVPDMYDLLSPQTISHLINTNQVPFNTLTFVFDLLMRDIMYLRMCINDFDQYNDKVKALMNPDYPFIDYPTTPRTYPSTFQFVQPSAPVIPCTHNY